jgi:hypothetical protein
LDSRLLLESEGWWWDRLDLEKDPSKLKGRRLILNEQELKNELKIRFSKAIYPEGNALRVNYGTYSWSSFAGLHDDSNIWRDDIHRCILSLMSIKGLKREEAEKEFITRILGDDRMGVKTEQTVRNWLSSPIDEEVCRVFRTYRTELKSNQELYRVMADISPGEQFDRMKGRRSYYAAMCLERLREQISRGEIPRSLKEHQIQIREVFRQLPIDSIHIMRIIRGRLVKQTDVMRCRDQMSYDDVFERIREV